ncbi:MAG: hypothetical protein ACE37D_04605 [Pseudomonadales bacterium]
MNFFKWLLAVIAIIVVAFAALLFAMRFHDGPVEIFSGGPFKRGEIYSGPEPDWNQFKDRATVQLQSLEPPRSRTLWLVVVDDRIFVPSAYMNTKFGKIWKQWPRHAVKDGRALLRIDDTIYPRMMERLEPDHELVPDIVEALNNKYPGDLTMANVTSNDAWIFELTPRELN